VSVATLWGHAVTMATFSNR